MKKYLDVKWLSLLVLNVLLIAFVCVKNQSPANHNELNILGE